VKRQGRQPGTRAAALEDGNAVYISRCSDGHDGVRRTANRACRECQRLRILRLRTVRKIRAWRKRVGLPDQARSKRGVRCVEAFLAHPQQDSGPGRRP
jgi:hypothetical protein